MAVELQKVQASLIKSQTKLDNAKQEHRTKTRDLRAVIVDQDHCIKMLEQKNGKLEAKLAKATQRLD